MVFSTRVVPVYTLYVTVANLLEFYNSYEVAVIFNGKCRFHVALSYRLLLCLRNSRYARDGFE